MPTLDYTLTRGDEEIELSVDYSVSKFYPATGPSWSSPGEPAEGGDVEHLSAFLDGDEIELMADEADEIEAHILMTHEDDDEAEYYEAAE